MNKHERSIWWPNKKNKKKQRKSGHFHDKTTTTTKKNPGHQAQEVERGHVPGKTGCLVTPVYISHPERCWLGCPSLGQEAHCPRLPRLSVATVKHDTFLDVARRSERKKKRLQRSRPHEKCWQLSLTISRPSEDGCWSERQDGANGNVSVGVFELQTPKILFLSLAAWLEVQQWEAGRGLRSRLVDWWNSIMTIFAID